MPLLTADIRTILEAKGLVKFPEAYAHGNLIETATHDAVVQTCYSKHRLTASTGDNTITLTRVANDKTDNNCINIHTIDQVSAIGPVKTPGYVYTGNFTGCVFYLFKTSPTEVTGVHAYSGMVTTTKPRFLRKPKITQSVREFAPTDYYTRHVGQQICRYPTRGELRTGATIGDPTAETSLNYLACVEATKATTFLFSFISDSENKGSGRVARLLATHEATF